MSTVSQSGFRRLWLAGSIAQTEADTIKIYYPTFKEANNFRLRMYAYAKKFRQQSEIDPELSLAIGKTEVCVKKIDGEFVLVIRPDWMNEQMAHALASLGVNLGKDSVGQGNQDSFAERLRREGLLGGPDEFGGGGYDEIR